MAENKISDLLQSRERTGRTIILAMALAALGAVGLYWWGQIVPWLVDVAYDTAKLGMLCAGFVVVGLALSNERLRLLVTYMATSAMRWVTAQFTDVDPIGFLKTRIGRMKSQLKEMDEAIGELEGQCTQLSKVIDKNEEDRVQNLQRAKHAKQIVDAGGERAAQFVGQVALSGRQAGRLGKSNETLKSLLTRIQRSLERGKKMRETSAVLVADMEAEVKVREQEYKAINSVFSVMKRSQSIMSGGVEKEMTDDVLERLANDASTKMGQIDYFMEVSRSVVNGVDLDNMAYEEDALAQLAKWEEEEHAPSGPRVAAAPTGVRIADAEEPSPDSFGSLFEKDNQKGGRR